MYSIEIQEFSGVIKELIMYVNFSSVKNNENSYSEQIVHIEKILK
jgi:hypothetical protein